MQKTLILWDIDGTILHSTGAGMKALNRALETVFGIAGSFDGIDFAGRTDPLIIRQIFARFGIEHTPGELRQLRRRLRGRASRNARRQQRAGPSRRAGDPRAGASDTAGVAQGLLTGNLGGAHEIKLGFHGLWEYFPVGAFADDSEIRNELGPHAHRRARGHWGDEFPVERVWIVGDTPHDIACARAFGARALAVATGSSGASPPRVPRPGHRAREPRQSRGLLGRGAAIEPYLFAAGSPLRDIPFPQPKAARCPEPTRSPLDPTTPDSSTRR